jgi:hypothetical protein
MPHKGNSCKLFTVIFVQETGNVASTCAFQMFHSQMQNQECKIEAIEKNPKAVGKMMKKLLNEKHKK